MRCPKGRLLIRRIGLSRADGKIEEVVARLKERIISVGNDRTCDISSPSS